MTAFDQAWEVVKAIEMDPALQFRPFQGYRAVPTSNVEDILSEGIKPRPIGGWYNWNHADQYEQMGLDPFESEVVWSFGHRPGFEEGSQKLEDIRYGTPYFGGAHPLLTARYFADALGPLRQMITGDRVEDYSIIGAKELPGVVGEDPSWAAFQEDEWAAQPLISTEMIDPDLLEEVIPVTADGEVIRFTEGSGYPDHIREEWGDWD